MSTTPNLTLPYLEAAQSQKHVTHNEALRVVDAIVQLAVIARNVTSPLTMPNDGDRYLVPAGATGAWTGSEGRIAAYQDGAWTFYIPRSGWIAWISSESIALVFNGSAWIAFGGGAATTNLSTTYAAANVLIASDTGTDATINQATASLAGVMAAADKVTLDGLISGTTRVDKQTVRDSTLSGFSGAKWETYQGVGTTADATITAIKDISLGQSEIALLRASTLGYKGDFAGAVGRVACAVFRRPSSGAGVQVGGTVTSALNVNDTASPATTRFDWDSAGNVIQHRVQGEAGTPYVWYSHIEVLRLKTSA